jgi:hypothetical protein
MYVITSWRVVVKAGKDGGGATFATVDQTPKKVATQRVDNEARPKLKVARRKVTPGRLRKTGQLQSWQR